MVESWEFDKGEYECPNCGGHDYVDTADGRLECLLCGIFFSEEDGEGDS